MVKQNDFKINFICIGPERSGTTWLYQCLKEHPEICVSEPKEVNFFNTTQSFWRKDLIGTTNYNKGIEWYKQHFSHCSGKKIVGEVTPIYLHSPEVPQRIHKNFPDAKLIAILRNPTERLFSHYTYTKLKGFYELPSFEEVIEKERNFVEESCYFKHLQNYLKYFPQEQILIMIYEDIEKDPSSFIKRAYKFIDVDESFVPPSLYKTINPAGAVALRKKALAFKDFLKRMPGGKLLIGLFKKTPLYKKTANSLATKTGTVRADYGKLRKEIRERLNEFYREDIKKLEKLIGRDLTFWK